MPTAALFEVLRSIVVATVASERLERPIALPPETWPSAIWLAQRHGVLTHLAAAVHAGIVCPPAASVGEQLQTWSRASAFAYLAQCREVQTLESVLADFEVAGTVVSACTLARRFHSNPERYSRRSALTLLVPLQDRAAVEAHLGALGYSMVADGRRDLVEFGRSQIRVRAREEWPVVRPIHLVGRDPVALEWWSHVTHALTLRRTWSLSAALDVVATASRVDTDEWRTLGTSLTPSDALVAQMAVTRHCFDVLDLPYPAGLSRVDSTTQARLRTAFSHHGLEPEDVVAPQADLGVYSPTPDLVVEAMLALAGVTAGDVVYDLGCGDGRLVVTAARQFGARAVGVEQDPDRADLARTCAQSAGVSDRVRIDVGDLRSVDLSDASVVCLYLAPSAYAELQLWLRSALRPGTRVVSHEMSFAGWAPEDAAVVGWGGVRASLIYLWRIPEL
jgi:SAM-dependent methyltransferase